MSRQESYPLDVPASSTGGALADGVGTPFPCKHLRSLAVQFSGETGGAEISIEGRLSPNADFGEVWAGTPTAGAIIPIALPLHAIQIVTVDGDASGLEATLAGELRSSDG